MKLGSRYRSKLNFVLYDPHNKIHEANNYEAAGFNLTASLIDDSSDGNIELRLQMDRVLSPFLFKYYLPCMAIVVVSQISFVIPPNAIPGRVALIVTQFLTLTNIFIYQMVSCCFIKTTVLYQNY